MTLKKQTVETIRFALNFLYNISDATFEASEFVERKQNALEDMHKATDAIDDFNQLLHLFSENSECDCYYL